MIDTHCHLLPRIDDGTRSPAEALALARQLVDAGVRAVVCTPHFSRRFPTAHGSARIRLKELTAILAEAGVPLELELAAEVAPGAAAEASTGDLTERRMGETHLLVELEPDTPAGFVEVALERLGEISLTPVFAHPERCPAVRSQPRVLDAARAAGALVQVVAPSLVGSWGGGAADAAWHLLESGRVDLLASDAHRPRRQGTHLAIAAPLVAARLGAEALTEFTERGPARIVGPALQAS